MTCKNIYPELQAWIDRNAAFRRQEQAIAARIDQATGLGLNEFYFLYYLSKCPERRMRVQEAQELIQMSQSAMSRLIQRLEGMEPQLVYRATCNIDKRGVYAHLTDAGHDAYLKAADAIRDILGAEPQSEAS